MLSKSKWAWWFQGMRFLIGHREPESPAQFVPTWMHEAETVMGTLKRWKNCTTRTSDVMTSTQSRWFTHRWAMPALRTAQEMAFTAVHREFSSVVSSPVPFAFLPSSMTKRVTVTTLVSKGPCSDMAVVDLSWNPESRSWRKCCGT